MRHLALSLLKYSGVLALARRATRRRLRILCYHGISLGDEHEYAPVMFMRAQTFERRMKRLARQGWRIVDLDTAIDELLDGRIVDRTLVVTIDDGWISTLRGAAPVLRSLGIPATVYVTTYYAERRADVFNVALLYMLWKTPLESASLSTGYAAIDGTYDLSGDTLDVGKTWIRFANEELDYQTRQDLLRQIAAALELDPDEVLSSERFRLMDRDQVRQLRDFGLDVQLHTHRHHLPHESAEALQKEVLENRAILEAWTGKSCPHFCYPSGVYSRQQSEWLSEMGLKSSTTCDPGLNEVSTHPHRLRRILDRESWSDLEFDTALCGLSDLLRRGLRREGT